MYISHIRGQENKKKKTSGAQFSDWFRTFCFNGFSSPESYFLPTYKFKSICLY